MLPTAQSPTLSSVLDQLTAALLSAGVDGPGIDSALHQFAGVPYQTVNKTGFNVLALHANSARGMVLSHPEMALRPWPAYKSFAPRVRRPPIPRTTVCLRRQPIDPLFCSCSTLFASACPRIVYRLFVSTSSSLSLPAQIWDFLPDTGPVHYYQEEILHAAVIGADSFFFFVRPKPPHSPAQSLTITRGRLMHIRVGRLDATTASHSASRGC